MIQTCIEIAMGAFALAMVLNLYRLLRGPGMPDRILALDTLSVNTIALLVLAGLRDATTIYFEAAVVIAMLGFVTTIVLSKYVIRGDIVE
jgi:multicomponent K+:H+ antiporter subunit F